MTKRKEPNYKGFCEEYEERKERGFPMDMTTLREMAEKYHTPLPNEKGEWEDE